MGQCRQRRAGQNLVRVAVGIGNVQGYFFSKAMPPEAVPQWHKAYRPAEITVLPPRPSVAASPFLAAPAPMPS